MDEVCLQALLCRHPNVLVIISYWSKSWLNDASSDRIDIVSLLLRCEDRIASEIGTCGHSGVMVRRTPQRFKNQLED